MQAGLVSIVIPTYNDSPEQLAESLASARAQTYAHVEIIVVDDGSNDPVQPDGVRVIRQANAGPAAAMNAGIRAASGEYVITLGGDDWLSTDFAQEAAAVLSRDPTAVAAYPRVREFGEATGLWWPTEGRRVDLEAFAAHSPISGTSAFRRVDWETAGGFDETLRIGHEDHEFWIRLLGICGGYAVGMPTATLHYRIRTGSRARTSWQEARANTLEATLRNNSKETLAALLKGYEKHGHGLERQLERIQRDLLNIRSWPLHANRAARRIRRMARQH